MTWTEYYDKFYDWSESTQVNKLSSVEALGPADEVAEILMEFAFNRGEIANRLARKAVAQKIIFSADNLMDFTGSIDVELQNQLARLAINTLSKEDLEKLDGFLDADILVELYKTKGLPVPEVLMGDIPEDDYQEEYTGKQPSGFFSKIAMAFGIGHGISQGIKDATAPKPRKFRVGDHVRVRYRGQEGTIVDINGDLYMVSLKDGGFVDSYSESQLEKAW